ncbi:MAG: ABC transporter permease [Chloroflexi bacterium]|nr:ABC transporter permease [Chloroflexota bacterium]
MASYIIQRVLQMIPVMALATIISFSIIFLLPGDPALLILGDQLASDRTLYEAKRAELGLDRPLPIQYLDWLGKTVRGDLGISTRDRQPVSQGIKERLPVTLQLAGLSMLLALAISLPAGIISALKPNSKWDIVSSLVAFGGIAIPHFWLGILLIYFLAVELRWLPPSGYVAFTDDPVQNLTRMLMPAVTLGLGLSAVLMRQTRSSLLEVLNQDYMTTARAKGLGQTAVVLRHALKNGLIPVVTVLGLQLGLLFGGAIITESIFSIPGIGRWAVDSITTRDFPVVQAVSLVMAVGVLLSNLVADIAYAYIDPRIHYR